MRPINLIPKDLRRGDSAPSRTGPVGWVVVGVLALGVVAAVTLVTTTNTLSDRQNEVAALQYAEQVAQEQAAEVAPYTAFRAVSEARKQTVASLAASRFDWERVMRELALIVPSDIVIRTLTATVSPSVSVPGATSVDLRSNVPGPALELTGCGTGPARQSQEAVARLIAALYEIDGVTRVGMKDSVVQAGATAAGGGGQPGACAPGPQVSNFQMVAAFDTAPDPFGSDVPPPTEPTPATGEPAPGTVQASSQAGADSEAADRTAQASAAQAGKKANQATDRYLPGG